MPRTALTILASVLVLKESAGLFYWLGVGCISLGLVLVVAGRT